MNTPENCRLLVKGERILFGDEYLHADRGWMSVPEWMSPKDYLGHYAPHRRPITPTIPGLPEGLPVPPDAPEGHYGVYRGMGWESPGEVLYSALHIKLCSWSTQSSPRKTKGYQNQHYIEWVPIKEQAPEPASVHPVGAARELWIPMVNGKPVQVYETELGALAVAKGFCMSSAGAIRVREILPESDSSKPHGIEAQVCEDIASRQRTGMAKYGVSVAANPLELRQWLNHLYEELLDASVYLKRAMAENDAKPPVAPPTPAFNTSALWSALPRWARYAGMLPDGRWIAFEVLPKAIKDRWVIPLYEEEPTHWQYIPDIYAPPRATDWTTSLVERPGK